MIAKIKKGIAHGFVHAPTSKSMSHRLLICASLSEGESEILNVTFSEDILATLDCLKTLGAHYSINGSTVKIRGISDFNLQSSKDFYCRESGATLRFILPLLLLSENEQTLHGKGRLMSRPMTVYENICRENNLLFSKGDVIKVKGILKKGEYSVPGNISSQFITGLLFSLSKIDGESKIHILEPFESASYVNMTLQSMRKFGVNVKIEDKMTLVIHGGSNYIPQKINVEGDYSGASFLDFFNYVGGNVKVLGLNENSFQGDKIYRKYFSLIEKGTPNLDISDCPDLAPILMVLSSVKNGCKLLNTYRLKMKESNRGIAMSNELSKFGANIEVFDNEIIVHKSKLYSPVEILNGYNDHRIVMSLSVLLTLFGGSINDAEAVSKSFPGFFNVIKNLGIEVELNESK